MNFWLSGSGRRMGFARWRLVQGPLGAAMAACADIGWAPFSPSAWRVHYGRVVQLNHVTLWEIGRLRVGVQWWMRMMGV